MKVFAFYIFCQFLTFFLTSRLIFPFSWRNYNIDKETNSTNQKAKENRLWVKALISNVPNAVTLKPALSGEILHTALVLFANTHLFTDVRGCNDDKFWKKILRLQAVAPPENPCSGHYQQQPHLQLQIILTTERRTVMANKFCALCRFYSPHGDGTGYCCIKGGSVRHYGSCVDFEES